jgi:hypothetical protein
MWIGKRSPGDDSGSDSGREVDKDVKMIEQTVESWHRFSASIVTKVKPHIVEEASEDMKTITLS